MDVLVSKQIERFKSDRLKVVTRPAQNGRHILSKKSENKENQIYYSNLTAQPERNFLNHESSLGSLKIESYCRSRDIKTRYQRREPEVGCWGRDSNIAKRLKFF